MVQPGAMGFPDIDHHALYMGDNMVLHYNAAYGESDLSATVRIDPVQVLEERARNVGETVKIREHSQRLDRTQTQNMCMSRLHENQYNLVENNCEHLVNWCVLGDSVSEQAGTRTPAEVLGYLSDPKHMGIQYIKQ